MHTKTLIAAAILVATASTTALAEDQTIAPVVVTATRHVMSDTDAPYASEVHTGAEISASGAANLYDYLDRYTSLTVMPSYGNPLTQLIDMRGYGISSGYQNIVVTVDGRRLNNIDLTPQLLSAIPLSSIERIEITKGSGSVLYGDGATAGAIHIYTRNNTGLATTLSAGNHGISTTSVSAGVNAGIAALNINTESYHQDGFSDPDTTGKRDSANNANTRADLKLFPTDKLELRIGGAQSRTDATYRGYLTDAQYHADPAQNGGATYNGQAISADETSAGLTADLLPGLKLNFDHSSGVKRSRYSSGWTSDYTNASNDLAINYQGPTLTLNGGVQQFAGTRKSSSDKTSKDNRAAYIQGDYVLGATTVSAGARRADVGYTYDPTSGSSLNKTVSLSAWDIGLNHRYNNRLSVFANYNNAFEAPDIDRFFVTNWTTLVTSFNGFISPAHSRTLNLGVNREGARGRLKLTVFYAKLSDEIYYDPLNYINTNIDKSHKYGLELQTRHRIGEHFSTSLNYAYTRAIIDRDNSASGAYNGKTLPGVSAHTATFAVTYRPNERSSFDFSQTYRSSAYAANDFANNFSQKQASYNSTDLGYHYRLDKMELFAKVENLFNKKNGLWISNNVIYPVNFSRNWRVGVRAEF